jgi:hypothetical protein
MSLIKEIRSDPTYKKFKEIYERTQQRVDIEAAYKEATMLHESRIAAAPKGDKRYSAQRLIDANMLDLSVRSRLVRIRVKNAKAVAHLEAAMAAMRQHILSEYSDDLTEYKTESMRKAVIDRVMKSATEFVAGCQSLTDTIDTIIKDIDQSSFGIRHTVDLLKLLAEKSSGRVLGAQAVGASVAKRIDTLAAAISLGATLEDLSGLDLAYAPPFNTPIENIARYDNVETTRHNLILFK